MLGITLFETGLKTFQTHSEIARETFSVAFNRRKVCRRSKRRRKWVAKKCYDFLF